MARIKNAITFGSGFNISAAAPIDSRMRVEYESDLTNASTWDSSEAPLYDGLSTVVMETGDIWVLLDKTKYTDISTGKGWVNKGKGSEIDDTSSASNKTWSSNKISSELSSKQDTLTAGQNIVITNNTISAVIDAGFSVEVVQSLPSTGATNTIYFLPISGGTTPDVYDEYMYINNAWEKIGSTSVDLSNYYNKTEVDTLLSGKQGTLTAGNNITINGSTISANDTTYTAGDNISINNNVIKSNGYRFNTTTGAFAEGDRDINDDGTVWTKPSATGVMAHAEGSNCTASGRLSHAEGIGSVASGNQGHAEGWFTKATTGNAHAEGRATEANAIHSHSEGNSSKTNSTAESSHAEGYSSETGGNYTSNTKTAGTQTGAGAYAHAEGNATIAKGIASHAEGRKTFASGLNSHAEGGTTQANGENSHAEGNQSVTLGNHSHAEGTLSTASGNSAHAEGRQTIASGTAAHAEGIYTKTTCNAEHAQGSYNVSHTDNTTDGFGTNGKRTIHSIGIGTADDARVNAVEVMQNGDVYIKGIGNYDGNNLSGSTLQTVVNGKQNTLTAGSNIVISGDMISAVNSVGFTVEIVQSLPSTGSTNTIYLVPTSTANVYNEYMYINNAWAVIGTTEIDLSGYYTKTEVDNALTAKQNTLTAGSNITIDNDTISATDTTYVAGDNIDISGDTISAIGYDFNGATDGGFAEKYKQDSDDGGDIVSNTATGLGSHAEGYGTTASGDYGSHAEGNVTTASGFVSHAEGSRTTASGTNSHAEGNYTVASGQGAHVEGSNSNSTGKYAHAEGVWVNVGNYSEHAQGTGNVTHSSANNAATEWQGDGNHTLSSIGVGRYDNTRSNAIEVMQNADVYIKGIGGYDGVHIKSETGYETTKTLQDVISDITLNAGNGLEISGNTISLNGLVITKNANGVHFATQYVDDDDGILKTNVANGAYSDWAEGSKTTATSVYGGNHAEGYTTSATGMYGTHSEGAFTQATGDFAHAEGGNTIASGQGSHAEGCGTYGGKENTAYGEASHVEGIHSDATGKGAHAEGWGNINIRNRAYGYGSHVEGSSNVANNKGEHAEGCSNISHSSANNAASVWQGDGLHTVSSIGMGSSPETRKNAFELMQNGDLYLVGVGGYDGIHIKGESGAPTGLKTLQEYIAALEARIAALENQ